MAIGDIPVRVGRWATAERREARRDDVLDTVLDLLEQHGYEGTSMQKVAAAARMSKETLYSWFGDKAGLFEALVSREAESMNRDLGAALDSAARSADPREVLTQFGVNVLRLLLGPRSLAINRAAVASGSPELGRIIAARGRENTRPLVERYLESLGVADPGEAFEILMGLLVRDLQVRMLLGVAARPGPRTLEKRAEAAVDAFLRLCR